MLNVLATAELAVEGFVSFGLGFCLSRPLPNEKTAKKEKTKNSRKRLIYSFAYLYFRSFYFVRIARLLEKACGNSYLQLKVPSHLISDFVYVLRQQKIDKKEENLNLTYLPILIISHFFLQHFRRISEWSEKPYANLPIFISRVFQKSASKFKVQFD